MTGQEEHAQFCTFELAGLLFGIDVQQTQEIITDQPVTPVPRAADSVKGLINLRGRIVSAIDLRECLGLESRPENSRQVNLIVQYNGEPVSLLVDRMGDVLSVDDSMFVPAPETVDPAAIELIQGAYKLAEGLLMILDVDRIVSKVMNLHSSDV